MTLRSARIQRGVTIEQVAQDTRISGRFLEALENETFQELPAPVYVRGFLRSYANYLRLDPAPLLEQLPAALLGGGVAPAPATAAAPEEPVRRGADPFRPGPSRPLVIGDDDLGPAPASSPDPFSSRRAESETPLDIPYESPYRRGRVGGVLVERGAVYEDNGRAVRLAALVGGGLVVLALLAFGVMALRGGDDGNRGGLAAGAGETPRPTGTGQPIVVGSTTPRASATVTGSATVAPETTATAATTPGGESTATATSAATNTPTPPAPTPTATPTSVATPTATVEPIPGHGNQFSECPSEGGQPQCGSPMTVVCPPGEGWFVDYGNDFPAASYGYPTASANTNGEALNAGATGCA